MNQQRPKQKLVLFGLEKLYRSIRLGWPSPDVAAIAPRLFWQRNPKKKKATTTTTRGRRREREIQVMADGECQGCAETTRFDNHLDSFFAFNFASFFFFFLLLSKAKKTNNKQTHPTVFGLRETNRFLLGKKPF